MRNLYIVLVSLFFPFSLLAAESGFLYKGKEYVVYKDGEKVGKTFSETFPKEAALLLKQNGDRGPAQVVETDDEPLNLTIDGNIKCYRSTRNALRGSGGAGVGLSCVIFK